MKQARFQIKYVLAIALLLGVALAAACGGSEKQKKDSLVDQDIPNPPFLAEIPADTPYAMASLEALPVGTVLDRMSGMFEGFDAMVERLETELQTSQSPDARQALELMRLMKGKYTREGMTEIGMSLNPRAAIYGIGFYPMMRLEVADAQKFKNFVDKAANIMGAPLQSTKRGEQPYQYLQDGEARFFISYRGTEMHVGLTEPSAESIYLPYFFGEQKPANPISKANSFEEIKEKYGFMGFAVGFIDFEQIAAAMVEPKPGLNGETWIMASDTQPRSFTPECQQEIKSIAANFPRVVAGYTQFDEKAMGFKAGIETRTTFGSDLAAAKSPIPAYGNAAVDDALLKAGVGVSIQKLMQSLQAHAASIREAPYQCQDLAMLNQWAQQASQVGLMLPPALTQLNGLHIAATRVDIDMEQGLEAGVEQPGSKVAEEVTEAPKAKRDEAAEAAPDDEPIDKKTASLPEESAPVSPVKVEGFAFISTSAPTQLMQSLRLMMPELAQLQIKPDGTPQPLPALGSTDFLIEPHAVMTQYGIAISSGAGAQTVAADALAAAPAGDSPMMVLTFDLSRFKSLFEGLPSEDASLIEPFLSQGPTELSVDPEERGIFMEMKYRWNTTD